MATDDRRPLMLLGLGLLGVAGYELTKSKPAPAPVCGPGTHLENGKCVPDPVQQPPAPTIDPRPVTTATAGLLVRSGPGQGYPAVGSLPLGTHVSIACQTWGQMVGRSAVWDQLSSPVAGYVSDWYVTTPNIGSFSPGYAVCSGTGAGPGPGNPGTGPGGSGSGTGAPGPGAKSPVTRWQDLRAGQIISTRCAPGAGDYLLVNTGRVDYPGHLQIARRWIADWPSYQFLTGGNSRAPVTLVAPAVLGAIYSYPRLKMMVLTRHGVVVGRVWEDFSTPQVNLAAAGYCR